MGIRSLVGVILAAGLSGGFAEQASAGVRMVAEIEEFRAGPNVPRRAEIWVDGSQVRIDDAWGAAGVTWNTMLYRADEDVFVGLDRTDRSYIRIDRSTLTAIGARVRVLRRALDAQLGMLSSEQRATAARMLGSSEIQSGEIPPLRSHDTGDHEVVDGRDCRVLEIQRDGRSVGRVWIASWDAVAVDEANLGVFRKLASLLGELNGSLQIGGVPAEIFEVFSGFGGFPVRVLWTRDGSPQSEVRFISVAREGTRSQLFEVPADYHQRSLPGGAPARSTPASAAPKR